MADLKAELERLFEYNVQTGEFIWRIQAGRARIGSVAGSLTNRGYVLIKVGPKQYQAHRLSWLYVTGEWPIGPLDHINGDKTDNRFSNLRIVTPSQNQQNRIKASVRNKTGLIGAYVNRGSFSAYISVNGKYIFLGGFRTAIEAHECYLKAKLKYHPIATKLTTEALLSLARNN